MCYHQKIFSCSFFTEIQSHSIHWPILAIFPDQDGFKMVTHPAQSCPAAQALIAKAWSEHEAKAMYHQRGRTFSWVNIGEQLATFSIWLFNIAMENHHFNT